MLGDPAGAIERSRLLVGGAGEQHVAPEARDGTRRRVDAGLTGFLDEALEHAELERDHPLHVDGSAAVDVPVGDVRGERVMAPTVGGRGDDIEV